MPLYCQTLPWKDSNKQDRDNRRAKREMKRYTGCEDIERSEVPGDVKIGRSAERSEGPGHKLRYNITAPQSPSTTKS